MDLLFVNNTASSQPEIKWFYYLLSPQEKEGEINMDLLRVCLLEGLTWIPQAWGKRDSQEETETFMTWAGIPVLRDLGQKTQHVDSNSS